jgi:hypothetical protein
MSVSLTYFMFAEQPETLRTSGAAFLVYKTILNTPAHGAPVVKDNSAADTSLPR